MLRKNYYVILGIPQGESIEGVRAAYRDLAKRHHPDVAGPAGAGRFREITEAYEVLSDPVRRRQYNHDLAAAERAAAEPVLERPPSIFGRPENILPSFDELFERYVRNFTGAAAPKAERVEGLNIEVVLSPEEAVRGGILPVGVPVFRTCTECSGTGQVWLFPCLDCRGQGLIERLQTVRIRIPPGARPGTVLEFPLEGLGIHNFYLRLHLTIGRAF